jgi:hypothetical protein
MSMSDLRKRFEAKYVVDASGCWLWQGFIDKAGYGRLRLGGRTLPVGYAHRISHELFKGPIPEGLHIDHLCRVRICVNPDHLEAVTNLENVRRGASLTMAIQRTGRCTRGHDLIADGYFDANGKRYACRECTRLRNQARAAS